MTRAAHSRSLALRHGLNVCLLALLAGSAPAQEPSDGDEELFFDDDLDSLLDGGTSTPSSRERPANPVP